MSFPVFGFCEPLVGLDPLLKYILSSFLPPKRAVGPYLPPKAHAMTITFLWKTESYAENFLLRRNCTCTVVLSVLLLPPRNFSYSLLSQCF